MSGHSKWHKIRGKKGAADAKRGNLFTKLAKAITVAAASGGDPDMNFSLRLAIDKAKAANLPKDNIERAIRRGSGETSDGNKMEEVVYEGFGPGGTAILIEAITDNKNRAVSEIKHVLTKFDGSLGDPGSVKWQFEQKGVARFTADKKLKMSDWEEAQLKLMDAGVQDIRESADGVELISLKKDYQKMAAALKNLGIESDDCGLQWVAKEEIALSEADSSKLANLYDALDELDDVNEIYTNEK